MDQDAIYLYTCPVQGKGEIWCQTRSLVMQLQLAAATWRIETRSDSAFYKITLVFVTACSASYQLL